MTDILRKKVLYMSTHRGCKEMDIILGQFAESEVKNLTDTELLLYEKLLEISDEVLYSLISGSLVRGYSEFVIDQQESGNLLMKISLFHKSKGCFG
jgi:succinate dehydrogenase flavin-adding protein (antitoxin of CptAB toxin-antitoxin module)